MLARQHCMACVASIVVVILLLLCCCVVARRRCAASRSPRRRPLAHATPFVQLKSKLRAPSELTAAFDKTRPQLSSDTLRLYDFVYFVYVYDYYYYFGVSAHLILNCRRNLVVQTLNND
jgi:hypothetical protein